MANEINQIKVGSTTYTLQDSRVDDLVTGVSSVNSKTGDVSLVASDVGALPISGGTIAGTSGDTPLYIKSAHATASYEGFQRTDGTTLGYFGYSSKDTPAVYLSSGAKTIYHTGNLPTIPTVNNGTLTIQKNGTSVGTFTANQSGNTTANITVPTTASDVGAAPSTSGTYFVNGTQTASTNAWTGTLTGITPYDGLAIRYYLPYAGTSTGATLALNGGTAYPVYRLGTTTQITTHFGAGSVIAMTFRTSYNVAGTTKTNAWICEAFYDSNTNTQVRVYRQDASGYNKDYPLIASRTVAADLGTVGTESSYESVYGLISDTAANIPTTNPYTGETKFKTVTATTFNGDLSGNATTATTADNATKLGGQAAAYYENKVTSVNNKTGAVSLSASDVGALSTSGGTLSGTITLTSGDVIAPYLAAKSAGHETTSTYGKIATLSTSGYIRYRTPAEIRSDIGAGTSNFSGAYADLSGKPTIPTVNNGTLTITENGTSKGTFTANQSGDTTIALTNTTYSAGDGLSLSGTTFSWSLADRIKAGTSGTKSVYIGDLTGSTDMGSYSFSAGKNTKVSSYYSAAIGSGNTVSGDYALAVGSGNTTSGDYGSALGGFYNTVSGNYSGALGYQNTASGNYSLAAGYNNTAGAYQTVIGRRATTTYTGPTSSSSTAGSLFIIGKGTSSSALSNAFRVMTNGAVYGAAAYNSSGADYAEMWEWADGNPNNEDRRGKFVTVDENNKIRIATTDDEYILGIISATPCVVGDVQSENWREMYLKDVFGQPIVKKVDVPEHTDEETGELVKAHTEEQWVLNPEYDPTRPYVSRDERKEWAAVGLMGKLVVIDDGTCVAGRYCKLTGNGTATASTDKNDWRVLKRMDSTHVQILYR